MKYVVLSLLLGHALADYAKPPRAAALWPDSPGPTPVSTDSPSTDHTPQMLAAGVDLQIYGRDEFEESFENCDLLLRTIDYLNLLTEPSYPLWTATTYVTAPMLEENIRTALSGIADIAKMSSCIRNFAEAPVVPQLP
jgi:hypothetical protein